MITADAFVARRCLMLFWWRCLCKHIDIFLWKLFAVLYLTFCFHFDSLAMLPFNVFSMYYKLTSDWNPSHFPKCQNKDVGHQNQLSHVFNSLPLFYSLPLTLMWHGELLHLPYFVGIISASSPSLSISLVSEILLLYNWLGFSIPLSWNSTLLLHVHWGLSSSKVFQSHRHPAFCFFF